MTGNLYLVGFMGAGKSAMGRRLATALNRKFVDMDDHLAKGFGMPIREVFARIGEDVFRNAESVLLKRLSRRQRLVVATGGGVLERGQNLNEMRQTGKLVYLKASLETCKMRLSAEQIAHRPLWADGLALRKLFARRLDLYGQSDLQISVDGHGPQEVLRAMITSLFPDQHFSVSHDGADCRVICTWHAHELLAKWRRDRRVLLLTDQGVQRIHLPRYLEALGDPIIAALPTGERIKTLRGAKRIYERLLEQRMERGDLLVALGGGVITDLGAFVAMTYKRGMAFIPVATTLLGCVDAAIGGKAAVNIGKAKNVVGCFAAPDGVLLDIVALRTLPRQGIAQGLVEAYKTGLVASSPLAEFVEQSLGALLARDLPALAELVVLSAKTKAQVVSGDFREQGHRRILNFGHTFGHAAEAWNRYRIPHGQAVAAGMLVAARLSRMRGLISAAVDRRIVSTLGRIVRVGGRIPSVEEAWAVMKNDKKVRGGRLIFVLLGGVGKPIIVEDVSMQELAEAMAALEEA